MAPDTHLRATTLPQPRDARMLIAERGTDWLRALRSLSLGHQPFTTLVQANDDDEFLRERPWKGTAPREIVLLCSPELTAAALEGRLTLFRHVASDALDTTVQIVADSEDGALANEALLEVVRSLAPALSVRVTSLAALASEAVAAAGASDTRGGRRPTNELPDRRAA